MPNNVEAYCPSLEEWPNVQRAILDGFGTVVMPDDMSARDYLRPAERRIAVRDDHGIFGGCFAYEFELAMPGGARVPVAGLGGVSISPPSQGSGGFRKMMQAHLENSLALGDAASVLMASESGLYSRYGYGVATEFVEWQLPVREFSVPAGSITDFTVRLIHDREQAIATLQPIHEQALNRQHGGLDRSDGWWQMVLSDDSDSWFGRGPQFVAVVFDARQNACGYALYKTDGIAETATGHGRVNTVCRVSELVTVEPLAQVALIKYLSVIGMTRELIWELGPVDPCVRHYMQDPRQLWQKARLDMMWLRPLDLPALLCNRSYGHEGQVIIDYCDPTFDHLCKVWRLTVTRGYAEMEEITDLNRATNTAALVALDTVALGSVILGGTRVAELAGVGAVLGTEESIRQFDRLMLCDTVPFNVTKF